MAFPHTVSPKYKIDKILMDNFQKQNVNHWENMKGNLALSIRGAEWRKELTIYRYTVLYKNILKSFFLSKMNFNFKKSLTVKV